MNNSTWDSRSVINNLIIINALVYLAQALIPGFDSQIVKLCGLHAPGSVNFYPHQLITYMFLHGRFQHLFFNMFALWMFGRVTEMDLGRSRLLSYYMLTGIGAGLLNMLVNWIQFEGLISQYGANDPNLIADLNNTVTIGASGAVFGILLSFGLMHPNERIMLLIPPIPMKAKYFVIIYGVLELVLGFAQKDSNVAHFAHVGGMLFGYIVLRYWKSKGKIYY